MEANIETAAQWIYNHVRYVMRAKHARARTQLGRDSQATALETEWVGMCWDIGHSLVMMQAHGISVAPVVEAVSARLLSEFPQARELEPSGFLKMRRFYLDYFERPHLLPKLKGISWACHVLIQDRCRDPLQQEFYLNLCVVKRMRWKALAAAMDSRAYELSVAASSVTGLINPVADDTGVFPLQGS